MGWNSWNVFGKNVNAQNVLATARRIKELGLDQLGYQYVVTELMCGGNCWKVIGARSRC